VAACPSSLVAKLFDGYADNFDSHLVEKLQYKTPSMLMWVLLGLRQGN
jgi:predicted TPR repeat methyltransferase